MICFKNNNQCTYSLLGSSNIIIFDMDETEQLKLFSKRIPKRPARLFLAGCWFAVAATTLLNKITFAGSDTRGNNYEWWRVTRVHQPGCLVVHDIDEIPIIDCPLQGIYPIGRWLNTRLLYSIPSNLYRRGAAVAAVHAIAL